MIIHTSPYPDVQIPAIPITEYVMRAAERVPERPALIEPTRPSLVGIRALGSDFDKRLRGGAHLVADPDSRASLGWVTSITRSVELDRWIGLAMLERGADRIGQRLFATFPLKGEVVEVEITSPHHVDPENARVRA